MIVSLASMTSQRLRDAGIGFATADDGSLRIAARNSSIGDLVVAFDEGAVSVFLGDITHRHFPPDESPEQATIDAASFIREVMSDQWVIWRWSDGRGGCYKPGGDDDEAADAPLPGEAVECFVWSGPYTP